MTDHLQPLTMSGGAAIACRPAAVLVEDTLAEMRSRIDETVAVVSEAVHGGNRELDDALLPHTRESFRALVEQLHGMLARGVPPERLTAPDAALEYVRTYVRAGLSAACLNRSLRLGQQAYARLWLQRLPARATDVDDLAGAIASIGDWLFGYVEAVGSELSEAYAAERGRHVGGALAMRADEVRAVLSGTQADMVTSSSRLGYRLEGAHVGFVVWHEGSPTARSAADGGLVPAGGAEVAAELLRALGPSPGLSVPLDGMVAGWAPVGTVPAASELPRGRDGLRTAIGRPGRGLDGFRRTHQEALAARRVATRSQRPSRACTPFAAVALEALMTADESEARRFVAHELGPLLDDSDATLRVRATLEVFLHEGSSFVRAARRLGVHENTVAHRVRRAETLLGRRTTERQLELRAALRLVRLVPAG